MAHTVKGMAAVFAATALLGGWARAQTEIFNQQIIVSPRGLETLPFGAASDARALGSKTAAAVPPLAPDDLRAISQSAGLYVPAQPGNSCNVGQVNCKITVPRPEQINLVDVGPSGDLSRVIEVTSTEADAVTRVLTAINNSASREASPNYWRRTQQQSEPDFYLQWGFYGRGVLGGANFVNAWNRTRGSAGTVVAVIDTGVVRNHIDIGPALVGGIDLVTAPLLAGDGDGADLDATDPGDFVDTSLRNYLAGLGLGCNAANSSWHGTHVAGTIAARTNAQFGAGGAPLVRILPVRVLGKCGGNDQAILDGLAWAMGLAVPGLPPNPNPAQVINMSLGGAAPCTNNYRRLFAEARRRGILVVVAAGNSGRSTSGFAPAGCPNVISVAAHDRSGLRASFSNYGSNVAVSAPGVDIYSASDFGVAFPVGSTTKPSSGTSMAAPHVAAALALLKSAQPGIGFDAALAHLRASASPFVAGSGCAAGGPYAGQCGSGMLNADALLAAAGVAPAQTQPPPASPPPSSQEPASGCFIATAAYGTPMAAEVEALREFRDQVLMRSAVGRSTVREYYRLSPPLANSIRDSDAARALTRALLWPVVAAVREPVITLAAAFLTTFAVVSWLRGRRRGLLQAKASPAM